MTALSALRRHLPEYLIEAWALGTFMISAGAFTTLLEYPGSPVHQAIADPTLRRVLIGVAMGLTAIALIYSPWGKRSGAHMNPAVTLTFLRLGKIRPADATAFIVAQFAGGTLGVLLVAAVLGTAFTDAPVSYAVTVPGLAGVSAAFGAEMLISGVLMFAVLLASNSARFAAYTGVVAGCLVALYIGIEAPLSGMSMNPARTFASAAPALQWPHLWVYLSAPVLGMLAGAQLYLRLFGAHRIDCGKLLHPAEVRCIHCGHEPVQPAAAAQPSAITARRPA